MQILVAQFDHRGRHITAAVAFVDHARQLTEHPITEDQMAELATGRGC